MKKKKSKSRTEMTHADWITIYGVGSEKRGAELLKILRDKIGVKQNEKTYAGFGGGWFFEQFIDRGFRLSTNDEGSAKVELQGLYWTGAVAEPFNEFQRIAGAIRTIEGMKWKLTRVDVAVDIFGLPLAEAFPNPKSKRYEWGFAFNYHEHQTKDRNGEMLFTGYTIQLQRWSLTVYDKRVEITEGNPHPIKQSYFETLAERDEPITRVELRVKTGEALVAVQGALQTVCKESTFCETILKHWGDYHRIKTKGGHDEARFCRLFREFEPTTFERVKKEKLNRLYDDFKEIKIRDKARDFIRYGINENQTADDVARIFQEQMDWLKENGELTKANEPPPSQKPKGDRSGSP
ncbi:MAG: hypothetical protein KF865_00490 [Bdellovibrionaceae bacterium]|nr:hypothetical protein [Pseudobdellovibrionaceae bacterium]